jgi:hypothetical protein
LQFDIALVGITGGLLGRGLMAAHPWNYQQSQNADDREHGHEFCQGEGGRTLARLHARCLV